MSKNGNGMFVSSNITIGKMREMVKEKRETGKAIKMLPILPWLLDAVVSDFEKLYEGKGYAIEKLVISSEK
jgi:hypothetical protein